MLSQIIVCGLAPIAMSLVPHKMLLNWLLPITAVIFIYGCITYFISAYGCNSFAVSNDALIVINPYFPYRKYTVIPLSAIELAHIGAHKPVWAKMLIFFSGNYADIQTAGGTARFYCIGLEVDAWDENMTERTIEQFLYALERKNVNVQSSLE